MGISSSCRKGSKPWSLHWMIAHKVRLTVSRKRRMWYSSIFKLIKCKHQLEEVAGGVGAVTWNFACSGFTEFSASRASLSLLRNSIYHMKSSWNFRAVSSGFWKELKYFRLSILAITLPIFLEIFKKIRKVLKFKLFLFTFLCSEVWKVILFTYHLIQQVLCKKAKILIFFGLSRNTNLITIGS